MAMKMETGERNLSSTWWKTSPAPSGRHEVPLKRQRCLCHVVKSWVQPSVGFRLSISFHLKIWVGCTPQHRVQKKGKITPNGRWFRGVCGNRSLGLVRPTRSLSVLPHDIASHRIASHRSHRYTKLGRP